ncbi:putative Cytochrome P450 [Seiridium unicorne]|uniref:Cytochrome P450 n=1 Tax=Seiridium unicorne TaxID=138068 RepID=A0ABR2ULL1_9PEZI
MGHLLERGHDGCGDRPAVPTDDKVSSEFMARATEMLHWANMNTQCMLSHMHNPHNMSAIFQILLGYAPSPKALVVSLCLVAVLALAYQLLFTIRYPKNLPRLGQKEGISWKVMRKRFHDDSLTVFNEIYENYSKKGKAVLIPVFGPNDEVILPPSALPWLVRQPDSVLSSLDAQIDGIQLQHTLGNKFAYDPWGGWLIKNDLSSALENIASIMSDELSTSFEANFGSDVDNWKELDLFPTCRMLAGQLTLRFTLGDSPEGRRLCRDPAFVETCYGVVDGMLDAAGYLASVRKPFKPFFGRWASRAMPPKIKALEERFEPLYQERLRMLDQRAKNKDFELPRDLLQMLFDYAAAERPAEAFSLRDMTRRLAVMNFGTMHQTILTLHNLFLDVLDSDSEYKTIAAIRDEVDRVMGAGGDFSSKRWTKANMATMTRTDSVSRETLRLHTFLGRAVQRLVIAKDGLVTEDGIHLPRGAMVSILAYQSQTDSNTFKEPFKYDPFRFSRPREAAVDAATGKAGLNNLSFVSSSAEYLPWNHGKHACPGRFLVDFEFKMILGYALTHYDMDFPESYGGKRPPNTWFVGFGIPPLDAKVRVRRRKSA